MQVVGGSSSHVSYVTGKLNWLVCALCAVAAAAAAALLRCIGLSAAQLSTCFTTDPAESPIQVTSWGQLGDTWPYFRWELAV
jgi:hypothetical protein